MYWEHVRKLDCCATCRSSTCLQNATHAFCEYWSLWTDTSIHSPNRAQAAKLPEPAAMMRTSPVPIEHFWPKLELGLPRTIESVREMMQFDCPSWRTCSWTLKIEHLIQLTLSLCPNSIADLSLRPFIKSSSLLAGMVLNIAIVTPFRVWYSKSS